MDMNGKEPILQISHLNKTLGKRKILQDVSFETYSGEVFGFLGPNGAGKTTTIKIVAGLLMLDEGDISICGFDLRRQFEKAMALVGGIVENPEFYAYLSGYDNLKIYANAHGNIPEERITEVVRMVGLENRIKDKVGKYSLGMRQRLGVAQAILHRPRLLVLDEPTNGLDPSGTKSLRDLIRHLAHNEGISVLVSSHLMSEMEMMCDRVGIITGGILRSVKPIDQMISAAAPNHSIYLLHVSDAPAALEALAAMEGIEKKLDEDGTLEVTLPVENEDDLLADINGAILQKGIRLYTVTKKENRRLEDVFIELTRGGDQIDEIFHAGRQRKPETSPPQTDLGRARRRFGHLVWLFGAHGHSFERCERLGGRIRQPAFRSLRGGYRILYRAGAGRNV